MTLLMLVGPSGVGKGTIIKELRKHRSDIWLSVSVTTRAARAAETHGVEYFFISRTEFEQMIEKGELLEWAEYAGNYYGTPKAPVLSQLAQGRLVILEVELAGARQIKAQLPDVIDVMVLPPSIQTLADRLNNRGTESPQEQQNRLEIAEAELAARGEFRFSIQNDTVSGAVAQLLPLLPAQS